MPTQADIKKKTVHEAIVDLMANIGKVAKDGVNAQQGYRFVGIDQITELVQPKLAEFGLTVVTRVVDYDIRDREGVNSANKPTFLQFATATVQYTITGPDGSSIDSVVVGHASDYADKAMNKALAAAAKYFFKQNFWIVTGDNEDADNITYDQAPPQRAQQGAPRQAQAQSNFGAAVEARAATVKNQAAPASAPAQQTGEVKPASGAQIKAINATRNNPAVEWAEQQVFDYVSTSLGRQIGSLEELTMSEASEVIKHLNKIVKGVN